MIIKKINYLFFKILFILKTIKNCYYIKLFIIIFIYFFNLDY